MAEQEAGADPMPMRGEKVPIRPKGHWPVGAVQIGASLSWMTPLGFHKQLVPRRF
jgi:hypothetical protein